MITQEDIDHFADMQSPIMDMGYYQKEAVKTAIYTDPIIYPALGLGNEAGEVQGKIKKMLRDDTFNKEDIAAEIGDVLWYIAALCRDLEVNMDDVATGNLAKLKSRKERGTIQGSGDNR
jgi:NTP pyrophosphatase (non-canonical NTP hydrolase)